MDLYENSNSQANTATAAFKLPGLEKEDVNIEAQWLAHGLGREQVKF